MKRERILPGGESQHGTHGPHASEHGMHASGARCSAKRLRSQRHMSSCECETHEFVGSPYRSYYYFDTK